MTDTTDTSTERHAVTRTRREPKRRTLTVTAITDLGPRMRRIEFTSPDLVDFESGSPDDHIKIFVPDAAADGGVAMRDYTPRSFDAAARRLTIDFAVHEAGPATRWALAAEVGDRLDIGGPRGSVAVADDFDWYLLIGDETALPAIGRRLEELRPGVPVTVVAVVEGPEDVQDFTTAADATVLWRFRRDHGRDDGADLRAALDDWKQPAGDGFVWIAAEAMVARALRDHFLAERGHPKAWVKAAGYWVAGEAGASDKMAG